MLAKPYYFIDELIKQLQPFGVTTVHCELRVGSEGCVGEGNSLLIFDVDIPSKKSMDDKIMLKMTNELDNRRTN